MKERREKICSIEDAISHIKDGDTIGLSGLILFHEPMALIRALIKRGVKDLTIVTLGSSMGADLLIGAGCVKRVVSTYLGFQHFAPISPNFRSKIEKGEGLEFWDYDFQHWHCALKAGGWNMPYLLTKAGLLTDLPKINPSLKEVEVDGEKWIAVPPITLDASLLYASKSDPYGNVIYNATVFSERILARATKGPIIVSVEEIVPNDMVRAEPRLVILCGGIIADYVVEVPYGAHPEEGQGYYMLDSDHIKEYIAAAQATRKGEDPDAFKRYLDKYVYTPESNEEYLERIGGIKKLLKLKQPIY